MSIIQNGGHSFWLRGGEHCVILLHGFSGSPAEMRWLGEYLWSKGFTVFALRLPGHSTCVEDLRHTHRLQWRAAVEENYKLLTTQYPKISVVGMSMGGLLALQLAAYERVHKVVSLATPIDIRDRRIPFLHIYKLFKSGVVKRLHDYGLVNHVRYAEMPINGVIQLLRLIKDVRLLLPKIQSPTLVMQSKIEHTLKPSSATYIYENLGSAEKQLVWLEHSGHMLVLGAERQTVFEKTADFLAQ